MSAKLKKRGPFFYKEIRKFKKKGPFPLSFSLPYTRNEFGNVQKFNFNPNKSMRIFIKHHNNRDRDLVSGRGTYLPDHQVSRLPSPCLCDVSQVTVTSGAF